MGFRNPVAPRAVRRIDRSNDSAVAAGASVEFNLTPADGWMWRFAALELSADAIGASGTHRFEVTTDGDVPVIRHLRGQSNFGTAIQFRWSHWFVADANADPPDTAAQTLIVTSLMADFARPLRIIYENATDAEQAIDGIQVAALIEAERLEER